MSTSERPADPADTRSDLTDHVLSHAGLPIVPERFVSVTVARRMCKHLVHDGSSRRWRAMPHPGAMGVSGGTISAVTTPIPALKLPWAAGQLGRPIIVGGSGGMPNPSPRMIWRDHGRHWRPCRCAWSRRCAAGRRRVGRPIGVPKRDTAAVEVVAVDGDAGGRLLQFGRAHDVAGRGAEQSTRVVGRDEDVGLIEPS